VVQFWDLYSICNEKTKTIAEIWVNGEQRLYFRRIFKYRMMQTWNELLAVVEQLVLNDEPDTIV
jgi:hypothetical protein